MGIYRPTPPEVTVIVILNKTFMPWHVSNIYVVKKFSTFASCITSSIKPSLARRLLLAGIAGCLYIVNVYGVKAPAY